MKQLFIKKLIIKGGLYCVLLFFLSLLLFPLSKILRVELRLENPMQYDQKTHSKILSITQTYKQKYLWQISLKQLVQKLQNIDKESRFTVKRQYPGRLIVFVHKKKTALLLLKSDNSFYSVSYEGLIGAKKNRTKAWDFPILRGEDFQKSQSLRQELLKILKVLPQSEGRFCWDNVSEIGHNKDNKSFLFYLTFPHFILELSVPPSNKKRQNIEFVLNYLEKQNRQKAFVDARSNKKIIVKSKK